MRFALRVVALAGNEGARVVRSPDVRFGNEIASRTANALEWRGLIDRYYTGEHANTVRINARGEAWLREHDDHVDCSTCGGRCYWSDDSWVCGDCGDEWYPDHGEEYAAP